MTKKIVWEPLGLESIEDAMLSEVEEVSEYEKHEEDRYDFGGGNTKLMPTPFGLAVIDNSVNPFKNMQLLQFHTNFPITHEVKDIIEETPGIEILKILTQYRGVISVAKLFNSTEVRREVGNRLIPKNEIPNNIIKEKVVELKTKLQDYSNWAIIVLPNGYIDYAYLLPDGSNKVQFEDKVKTYQEALSLSTAVLLKSPEVSTDE
jgi:hypothetical protein